MSGQQTVEPKKLLEFVTTVPVAAVERFKARDHFKVDAKKAAVRILWFNGNFQANFLGLTEDACEAVNLKVSKVPGPLRDDTVIAELADKCDIKLSQLFALLKSQGKGEKGVLLTGDRDVNIAYIRDVKGALWTVVTYWSVRSGGWRVEAFSVEDPIWLWVGYHVLSR